MKTTTLDVGGMLAALDFHVEKQLGRMPGVHRVAASSASNSVTVEYDETVTSVAALKQQILACGYHCTGEIMPGHVCEPDRAPAAAAMPMPAEMAHEMGHGAGMDHAGAWSATCDARPQSRVDRNRRPAPPALQQRVARIGEPADRDPTRLVG